MGNMSNPYYAKQWIDDYIKLGTPRAKNIIKEAHERHAANLESARKYNNGWCKIEDYERSVLMLKIASESV